MPTSEKQRRAAFAEVRRRKAGGKSRSFTGMSDSELEDYAHSPLHKAKKRSVQGDAVRSSKSGGY